MGTGKEERWKTWILYKVKIVEQHSKRTWFQVCTLYVCVQSSLVLITTENSSIHWWVLFPVWTNWSISSRLECAGGYCLDFISENIVKKLFCIFSIVALCLQCIFWGCCVANQGWILTWTGKSNCSLGSRSAYYVFTWCECDSQPKMKKKNLLLKTETTWFGFSKSRTV